jgi:hypothetical protein
MLNLRLKANARHAAAMTIAMILSVQSTADDAVRTHVGLRRKRAMK